MRRVWVTTFPRAQGRVYLGCSCGWRHDTGEGMPTLDTLNQIAGEHQMVCEYVSTDAKGSTDGDA